MNKFIAFAALALACLAVASASSVPVELMNDVHSELSLNPSDDEEVAQLEGKTAIFDDYCKRSRDYVITDIKTNTNDLAGNVFKMFFNGAEELGTEAVNVQQDAANRIGNQIRNPEAQIGQFDENNAVDKIIHEGLSDIQTSPNQPKSLFMGIVTTLAATKNAVTTKALQNLDAIRTGFGISTITDALYKACAQAAHYDRVLNEDFESTRQELAKSNPELASVELSEVACVTVRRVIRFDGVCKFAQAVQNPLIKFISYRPIPNEQ